MSGVPKKLGLSLKGVMTTGESKEEAKKEQNTARGEQIKIKFTFSNVDKPDFVHEANMGDTVEYLKIIIQQQTTIPFQNMVLSHHDKTLMDPLTLQDSFPEKTSDVVLKVDVKS